MAQIHNSDLKREIIEGAKIQTSDDNVPSAIADKVVPVMEVNPKLLRKVNIIKRATSSATLYTTPTDKDFYLVGFNMSAINTASGEVRLTATLKDDVAVIIGSVELGNTVAVDISSSNITQSFVVPILLERGTTIAMSSTGTQTLKQSTIFGYYVED